MRKVGIALLIFNTAALVGCAGGNAIDRAVPQAALADPAQPLPQPAEPGAAQAVQASADPAAATETDPLFSGSGQASLTGAYPNINVEPTGSTPQMTDEQRDQLLAEMQALADARAQGKVSTADYERRLEILRNLAATHSDETIARIEQ